MRKFFAFILRLALVAALAIWLADRPGSARIVWHGTVVETSAAFLGLCALALGFAFYWLFRLWHFLRHGPAYWRIRRHLDKMQKGQRALTQGLVAIAAGDAAQAGRLAVAARKSIGNGIPAQWLQAQAAQLAGDRRAAREIFRALAADPDAAVLGYRGLIAEARENGDWAEIDRLVASLHKARPATPWLSLMRMESAARRRDWAEAENALAHAVAAHLLDSKNGRRTRAALRLAIAQDALAGGDAEAALKAAEQATQQAPDWAPALIGLADILAASGHTRAAARLIERAWKKQPHPELARILQMQAATPLAAYKDTERLARANPDAPESRLALAEAALAADIWGEARRHLDALAARGGMTARAFKLFARLERRERGDENAAAAWLAKAADAPADPVWLCASCGGAAEKWQAGCAHCGAFDKIGWRAPGQSAPQTQALALTEGEI